MKTTQVRQEVPTLQESLELATRIIAAHGTKSTENGVMYLSHTEGFGHTELAPDDVDGLAMHLKSIHDGWLAQGTEVKVLEERRKYWTQERTSLRTLIEEIRQESKMQEAYWIDVLQEVLGTVGLIVAMQPITDPYLQEKFTALVSKQLVLLQQIEERDQAEENARVRVSPGAAE